MESICPKWTCGPFQTMLFCVWEWTVIQNMLSFLFLGSSFSPLYIQNCSAHLLIILWQEDCTPITRGQKHTTTGWNQQFSQLQTFPPLFLWKDPITEATNALGSESFRTHEFYKAKLNFQNASYGLYSSSCVNFKPTRPVSQGEVTSPTPASYN